MFYPLLKLYGRLAIKIYCKKIVINKPEFLTLDGPILLAANHPNSFLDGIILTTLFKQPVYALARGDAFQNKRLSKVLTWLRQLPVYRTTEGAENLKNNYYTFSSCHKKFIETKVVLIFSEACSINEWHLRPLRKGTARLALTSWQQNIPLKVIPVGINYASFKDFGKQVHINFGLPIHKNPVAENDSDGKQIAAFNQILHQQLTGLVYELQTAEETKQYFSTEANAVKTILLFLPAIIGWIVHAPLFYIMKGITNHYFKTSDHYDSVLTALLMLVYPFYMVIAMLLFKNNLLILASIPFILPFTAWCWVQLKHLFIRTSS